ncbi:hypothetical protein CesoFtcFv8_025442 [Champsocephalus esox]|uniref:Uncharacterized protein n=1 Tax=Champsocephalus esox TaxID=159716 RepID=A0AAN8GCP2_9TELE|nr:hypothetical protein CesoFtcFv8_025442 [Champsocephalus esox]
MLSPAQTVLFLGLRLNSVPFTARLSAERVEAFRACLAHFQPRKYVLFRSCLRLLGLMASAILVVRLGRLHMREFQRWVAALRLDPARRVMVTMKCVMALRHWLHPFFLERAYLWVLSYRGRWSL